MKRKRLADRHLARRIPLKELRILGRGLLQAAGILFLIVTDPNPPTAKKRKKTA